MIEQQQTSSTSAEDATDSVNPATTSLSPVWRAVLTGAVVLAVTAGLDWFLVHDRVSNALIVDISDVVGAVIIAVLSYRLFLLQREREQAVFRRLETIAAMNHHIRNALQVIAYTGNEGRTEKEVQAVRDAVARITWALREVLPKV